MSQFDNRRASQVWQRVHAAPENTTQESSRILALIPGLYQCAQGCGSHQELSACFRAQADSLRGIYTLLTGEKPSAPPKKPSPNRPPKASASMSSNAQSMQPSTLRSCYTQQLRCLLEYQSLCASKEFGPVFQALIPQAQENCMRIVALLGM